MAGCCVEILLITANVGSLFEDVDRLLVGWVQELHQKISALTPKFIAIHFQEIGGKIPAAASEQIVVITDYLFQCDALKSYDTVLGFFDQDYLSDEKFTALGALYFVHNSLKNIAIWNYSDCRFERLGEGKQLHTTHLDCLDIIEKLKYPKRFFPQMKWSRKGYLKSKWKIAGTIINLVNIHLFHDPSNLVAMQTSPSIYVGNRKHAFEYVLKSVEQDPAPCFIFGDFNFRLDTKKVVKLLSNNCTVEKMYKDDETKLKKVSVIDKKNENKVNLCVEDSKFELEDQQKFLGKTGTRMLKYDRELQQFRKWVYEFPITFCPSYPFCEDEKINEYVGKRCPSWCDRVLLTHNTRKIIKNTYLAKYDIIGLDTCMGDHKPISLYIHISGNETIHEAPKDAVVPQTPFFLLETSV